MSPGFNFLRIIGKAAYFIGVLLLFNFFFGLLLFKFLPWLIMGVILFVLFAGMLSIGKNIIFSGFAKTNKPEARSHDRDQDYTKGEVIDVEAQVFEDTDIRD